MHSLGTKKATAKEETDEYEDHIPEAVTSDNKPREELLTQMQKEAKKLISESMQLRLIFWPETITQERKEASPLTRRLENKESHESTRIRLRQLTRTEEK